MNESSDEGPSLSIKEKETSSAARARARSHLADAEARASAVSDAAAPPHVDRETIRACRHSPWQSCALSTETSMGKVTQST